MRLFFFSRLYLLSLAESWLSLSFRADSGLDLGPKLKFGIGFRIKFMLTQLLRGLA